jgi:hypothetical protein
MKRMVIGCMIGQLLGAAGVNAQTAEDMEVSVSAHMTRTNGAEDPPGMFLSTGALSRNTNGRGRFSVQRCGAMTLAGGLEGPFEEGSTSGWRVEIIPVRVSGGAATFRLKWIRALDTSKEMHPRSEDIELTMRPGDSRPMDSVEVPPDKVTGRRCTVWDNQGLQVEYSEVALRVSVRPRPSVERERRLIAADLWLIERLPTGAERTQALAVRGLPHRPMAFYFDAITEHALSLEILGHVVARPDSDAMVVELETRSRWGPPTFDWRKGESVPIRLVDSQLRLKAGETVEVALPRLDDSAGPFTGRKYAIRIRARQLR